MTGFYLFSVQNPGGLLPLLSSDCFLVNISESQDLEDCLLNVQVLFAHGASLYLTPLDY